MKWQARFQIDGEAVSQEVYLSSLEVGAALLTRSRVSSATNSVQSSGWPSVALICFDLIAFWAVSSRG